jgi:hypothetical protein
MYDMAITGGGDVVWAAAAVGDARAIDIRSWGDEYRSHMLRWSRGLTKLTHGRVGVVDSPALHLYHGSRKHRQYMSRHEALRRHRFDPEKHLVRDPNGMLRWSSAAPNELRDAVRTYIHSRREDE